MAEIGGRVVWHQNNVDHITDVVLSKRLRLVAEYLRGQIVKKISIPTRSKGPSFPGEAPHADTGRLKQSIFVGKVSPLFFFVGTNVSYGITHETGERPFIRPTVIEEMPKMRAMVQALGLSVSTTIR